MFKIIINPRSSSGLLGCRSLQSIEEYAMKFVDIYLWGLEFRVSGLGFRVYIYI